MVPSPPEVIQRLGFSKPRYCAAHIWCWPTSVEIRTSSRCWVSSCRRLSACWGRISASPFSCVKPRQSTPRHWLICSHQPLSSPASMFSAFERHNRIMSSSTCPASPTIGISTTTFLLIDEGSISTWILVELGENSSSLPVMRSSKRAPIFSITSQLYMARLAS